MTIRYTAFIGSIIQSSGFSTKYKKNNFSDSMQCDTRSTIIFARARIAQSL
jgi:hypothetical protein